jgi:hypothetical protein
MKKILTLLAGISIFSAAGAMATPTILSGGNSTANLVANAASENFTFNKFDASFGTLTAIDLIIQFSTLQGNVTINRTSGTQNITDMYAQIVVDAAPGFAEYSSSVYSYARTPSGTVTVNSGTPTQLVNVNGTTQSLIGGSPVTLSINPAFFGSYIGSGTIDYTVSLLAGQTAGGVGAATYGYANLLSPTNLALQYTYTAGPAPVPEPGQVAASLLLLGGIGAYVFIKRRKKSAPAAA